MSQMIRTVLIANRGEVAVRVARTLRRLGIRSVAVFTDPDAGARHVAACDEAVALGADPRAYLDIAAVVGAARRAGADAIHPGYGFLSENAGFAAACAQAGIVFLGPSAEVIESMGSKIAAKRFAVAAGLAVVPGRFEPGLTDEGIAAAAAEIGFPVLVKASAGGGGKGMRVVRDADELPAAVAAARREAAAAFGDDELMVERYLQRPRHIEVQVLGDRHGTVLAVADRECTLQRRHQKVLEEAPVTSLADGLRQRILSGAVALAESVGYVGAGTVEFVVAGDEAYFLEMNTRLQVEHPVTEAVTGLDLVELQVRIAEGFRLAELGPITTSGVAVEARLYAEDPANGFLPTGGRLLRFEVPEAVRVDSGFAAGDEVASHYDPMLAKIVAHGRNRAAALRALADSLARTTVLGVTTNLGFLRRLAEHPDVLRNEVHTRWIEQHPDLAAAAPASFEVYAVAALDRWLPAGPQPQDLWDRRDGWRLGEPAWGIEQLAGTTVAVRSGQVRVGDEVRPVSAHRIPGGVRLDGLGYAVAHDGGAVWVGHRGESWVFPEVLPQESDSSADDSGPATVRSPMPGTVIAVAVAPGQVVAEGEPLVTVEAMKMEHTLRAASAGTVGEVLVEVGARVALNDELVRWSHG